MLFLQKQNWRSLLLQTISARKLKQHFPSLYCTTPPNPSSMDLKKLCGVVSSSIGGLEDLEASLNKFSIPLTPSLVTQILVKEGRKMETWTFSVVAEALVKLGREEEALGIFKNLVKFKCPQDRFAVTAIVSARFCAKGHARKAEGVVWHHQDKISGAEPCIYRSLLYGWSELENVKAARRITQQMRSVGIMPDLFCYNTFLRCLCERNLKSNPSGLVPEALNVMMEMRSYQIAPTSISYNILLSCLGRTRRVKESVRILDIMRSSGCSPDWVSYYLVARVLFLKLRFVKGKQMVDKMMEDGLMPG
ncbi:pentatricopeptide repeat (PPR) superfamily protein [Actinidia rufa]|uniref:Pentatricopeptide repeat (PPR) superfamily protein n=1 Tax=Actinidia rufa TaxID=165716 RepID=A0A7J0GAC1_9ERIC|nr:pentatricopeptide repeat (PPR) superfamily protein [Actinidia rufa]